MTTLSESGSEGTGLCDCLTVRSPRDLVEKVSDGFVISVISGWSLLFLQGLIVFVDLEKLELWFISWLVLLLMLLL